MAQINIVEEIIFLLKNHSDSQYGGEPVTQGEHALQAAQLALENNEKESIIVACLLHDIGHLLHNLPNDAPENGIDDLHENLGFEFVDRYFNQAVAEPVLLHVDAKRYLCHREPAYFNLLSEPSVISLNLQGGIMTEEEAQEFEKNPFYQDAVILRRYDDMAKVPEMTTNPIEFYSQFLSNHLK
jgi:phosphonate degradation associated HDIG domain protein